MSEGRLRELIAPFFGTLSTNAVMMALSLAGAVISARLLGPQGRGELTAMLLAPMLAAQLSTLGTHQAITFFTARAPSRGSSYLAAGLGAALPFSLLVTAFAALSLPVLLRDYRPEVLEAGTWALLLAPLSIIYGLSWSVMLGRRSYRDFNLWRLMPNLALFVAMASLMVRRDAVAAISVYLGILVACTSLQLFVERRLFWPWGLPGRALRHPFRRYSLSCYALNLPLALNARLDQVFVLALLPAAALGHYAVASALGAAIGALQTAFGAIILPEVSSAAAGDRLARFARLVRLSSLGCVIVIVAIVLVIEPLVPLLFGPAFEPAVGPARLLVAAFGIAAVNANFAEGFRGLGRPGLPVAAECLSLAAKAAMLVALASGAGLVGEQANSGLSLSGAAIAALAGSLAALAVNLVQAWRRLGMSPGRLMAGFGSDFGSLVPVLRRRLRRAGAG